MKHPLISLCMIALNEEECIGRALADWKVLADELIVVVDSRTTDRTTEIVTAAGGLVINHEYVAPGHKGQARMVGIDAAKGEWIVVLDADEIIKDPAELRRWLLGADKSITAANVLFENYDNGNLTLRWYQVRVFRRGIYRYVHREHELPHLADNGQQAHEVVLNTVFEHRAPLGRDKGKMQPMMDRLKLDVEEHPNDPGPLYFLHRQYLLNGDYQMTIEAGHRFLALGNIVDPCDAYGNIATAHHFLGDTHEAIRWLHRAAAEQAHRRIWWVRLAEMHMTQGRWQIALSHLRLASELWPEFEWQWEPDTNGNQLFHLIDKCQRALKDMHHVHAH